MSTTFNNEKLNSFNTPVQEKIQLEDQQRLDTVKSTSDQAKVNQQKSAPDLLLSRKSLIKKSKRQPK